jgi:hypothetical protein
VGCGGVGDGLMRKIRIENFVPLSLEVVNLSIADAQVIQ